jgi:phage-related protein
MADGFKIADAFVEVHADTDNARRGVSEFDRAFGGSMLARLAPFIVPATASVVALSGALAVGAAGAMAAGAAAGVVAVGFHGMGDAIKKGGADLNKLAPEARSVAVELRSMAPAWATVQRLVQNAMFKNVSTDLRTLAANDLPAVRTGMVGMAGTVNAAIRSFLGFAASKQTVADITTGFDNANKAGGFLAKAVEPVLRIIRDVGTVGSAYLPQLAKWLSDMAVKAADFVSKARETGKLQEWVQKGVDAFKELSRIVGDVIKIVGQIAAASGFNATFLTSIRIVLDWVVRMLAAAPELVPIIAGILAAFRAWTIIQGIITGIKVAWAALNIVMAMNPIGIVVIAIAALVAILVIAYNHSERFRAIVQSVWSTVKSTITSAIDGIKTAIAWFGTLPGLFTGWFNGAKNAAASAINSLLVLVRGLPGNILSALGNLGNLLVGSGKALIMGLWNGFWSMIGWIKGQISGALSSIRSLFPFSPAKEGPFSGSGYTDKAGEALATDFGKGIIKGASGAKSAARGMIQDVAGVMPRGLTMTGASGVTASSTGGGEFGSNSTLDGTGTTVINIDKIVIDAAKVDDFNRVVEIVDGLKTSARSGQRRVGR